MKANDREVRRKKRILDHTVESSNVAIFGQAFLLIALGLIFIPILANVVKVPMTYLVPSVLSMAVFGAFGLTGDLSWPIAVLIFSVIGWLFKRLDYSVPAAVIGILLGGKLLGVLTRRARS